MPTISMNSEPSNITWEELCKHVPGLRNVARQALELHKQYERDHPYPNWHDYEMLKRQVSHLVGWDAPKEIPGHPAWQTYAVAIDYVDCLWELGQPREIKKR